MTEDLAIMNKRTLSDEEIEKLKIMMTKPEDNSVNVEENNFVREDNTEKALKILVKLDDKNEE